MSEDVSLRPGSQLVQVLGLAEVIGTSGELDRLRELIGSLARCKTTVIVVGGNDESMSKLAQRIGSSARLLNRRSRPTSLDVVSILLIPSTLGVQFDSDAPTLSVAQAAEDRSPIDSLFHAIAAHPDYMGIGILMHSRSTDGILGLRAISDSGGLTIMESPPEGLPEDEIVTTRRSMASGDIDHYIPGTQIPKVVNKFVAHVSSEDQDDSQDVLRRSIAESLGEIAEILHQQTNHHFKNYKTTTLVRRVERRLKVKRLANVEGYVELLRNDESERSALFRDLLISVTAFFRDPTAFVSLSEHALTTLLTERKKPLRIWVPGCASGEEAFTLAMLCDEIRSKLTVDCEIQIFATDIDHKALTVARSGYYPLGIEHQLDAERLSNYFVKKNGRYHVIKRIREMCLFSLHNLISDPPFSKLDLVSCRNLLIYLGSHLQVKLLPLFHFALNPDGFLFLGPSENLAGNRELFREVDQRHRIWQRRLTGTDSKLSLASDGVGSRADHRGATVKQDDLKQISQRIILGEFSPEWAVIDESFKIVCVSEEIEQFLRIGGGSFENHIISLAKPGIKAGLRVTLNETVKKRRRTDHDRLSMRVRGAVQRVHLTVQPMPTLGNHGALYMVVFQKEGPLITRHEYDQLDLQSSNEAVLQQLETDLARTREDLEKSVQELEAANEELRATNEELVSMNEELQTANEELESSKEELNAANSQLIATRNDLENLFQCSEIAMILLDSQLNVKGFTPSAKQLYNLIDSDIGRPLWHLTHNAFEMPDLPALQDIESKKPDDVLIRTRQARVFKRRIQPYRDQSTGLLTGMVVSFSDETRSLQNERRARLAIEAGKMGVWQWDLVNDLVTIDSFSAKLLCVDPITKTAPIDEIFWRLGTADRQRLLQLREKDATTTTDFALDCKLESDQNEIVWLRIIGGGESMVSDTLFGVVFDITEAKIANDKLEVSESFNRAVFENSPDCVKVVDRLGKIISINANGCRIMELDDSQAVQGLAWSSLWPEPSREMVDQAVQHSFNGRQVHFQAQCPSFKGTMKWWDVVVAGVPDESGHVRQVIAVSRDITKVKSDELLMQQFVEKLQAAIEVAEIGTVSIDYASDRVVCDPIAAKITGMEPGVGITRTEFHAIFVDEDRAKILELSEHALFANNNHGYFVEGRIVRPAGTSWVNLRKRNQYDANGRASFGLVAIQDVSALRLAQAELFEQHQRLRQILSASRAGTWDWDFESDIIVWSDESYALFNQVNDGRARTLKQCLKSVYKEDHEKLGKSIQQVIDAKGIEWRCEYRVKADVGVRWLLSVGEVEYNSRKEAIGMAGINLDITAHKELEQALIDAKIDAELAAKSRGEFLANMSHEIRTPMTAILGHTEILIDQSTEPDNLQSLDVIQRNGRHLLAIINDILDLSKIDAGRLEIKRGTVSPVALLADIRSLMDVRAAEKHVELDFRFERPIPKLVLSDELRLRQILINLIGNAIKFTDEGSVVVDVDFEDISQSLIVRIKDTGIGISEFQMSRLFDPFTQADTSNTRRFEGTGLGLAISQRLARALGGEITVRSQLGAGSEFTLTVHSPEASNERTQPNLNQVDEPLSHVREAIPQITASVLIVDDRRDIRLLAQHMVEKAGGRVITASNGQEALDLLSAASTIPVDLVLMDMQMPILDGYQAVRQLRQRGFTKPIIALTANAMVEDREKCIAAGCNDYATKPLDYRKLIALIAKLAEPGSSQ